MMRSFTACLLLLLTLSVQSDEVPHAIIQTNLGIIEVKLNPEKAPETVENFLVYVKEGFYENTIFHRVVNNFIIQGGGYTIDYQKKPTHPSIPNEGSNGLKNLRGTLAMARTADPNSSTSQFFINVKDNKFLDYKSSTPSGWGYCVFGKVVDGMDVVDKIARLPTDAAGSFRRDVPQTPVIIEAIKVEYVPVSGEDNSGNSEEKPEESVSDRQKKNASDGKTPAKEQAPSLSEMQQEMLKDLEDIEEEPAKDEASSETQGEEKKPTKDEAASKTQGEEKKPTKDEAPSETQGEEKPIKDEVPSETQREEKKLKEAVSPSEENAHEDEKNLSQQEESSQEEQNSDQVKIPKEDKSLEKKVNGKKEKNIEKEPEKVTDEQDSQETEVDKKSSFKETSKKPDTTEENKTMLSVVTTKKENALLKKETKKMASTPPDSPTLPDKPEPPMN